MLLIHSVSTCVANAFTLLVDKDHMVREFCLSFLEVQSQVDEIPSTSTTDWDDKPFYKFILYLSTKFLGLLNLQIFLQAIISPRNWLMNKTFSDGWSHTCLSCVQTRSFKDVCLTSIQEYPPTLPWWRGRMLFSANRSATKVLQLGFY